MLLQGSLAMEKTVSVMPQVGERVKIESRDLSRVEGWPKNRTSVFEGKVVPTFPWLEGGWICITSNDYKIPMRSFRIENIVKIVKSDGSETQLLTPKKAVPEPESWTVKGSKGNTYVVTQGGKGWHCTCVAGGFGRACKHVKEIQAATNNTEK